MALKSQLEFKDAQLSSSKTYIAQLQHQLSEGQTARADVDQLQREVARLKKVHFFVHKVIHLFWSPPTARTQGQCQEARRSSFSRGPVGICICKTSCCDLNSFCPCCPSRCCFCCCSSCDQPFYSGKQELSYEEAQAVEASGTRGRERRG